MSVGDIFAKSELGIREITDRKMKLVPRLRTMLILVDGQSPAFLLKEEAAKVGAPADFLKQLLDLGLIVFTGSVSAQKIGKTPESVPHAAASIVATDEYSRFRAAKNFMNVTVVNALGIKSFFFTLKLERAGRVDDLRLLVDEYTEAIAKGSDAAEAEVLTARLKELLR